MKSDKEINREIQEALEDGTYFEKCRAHLKTAIKTTEKWTKPIQ